MFYGQLKNKGCENIPRGKAKQKKIQESESGKDDWEIVGWVNDTKGKVLSVSDANGNLIGYIAKSTYAKFEAEQIDGMPIKLPPKE